MRASLPISLGLQFCFLFLTVKRRRGKNILPTYLTTSYEAKTTEEERHPPGPLHLTWVLLCLSFGLSGQKEKNQISSPREIQEQSRETQQLHPAAACSLPSSLPTEDRQGWEPHPQPKDGAVRARE